MQIDINEIISSHQGGKWFEERLSKLDIYNVHSLNKKNLKDEITQIVESMEDNDCEQTIVIYSGMK